jgi:hypothetical protein
MALAIVSLLLMLAAVFCALLMLVHAFRRSVGTGMMVLWIPFFIVYYAFAQFEHRQKGLILAGCFGGGVAALVLRALSLAP